MGLYIDNKQEAASRIFEIVEEMRNSRSDSQLTKEEWDSTVLPFLSSIETAVRNQLAKDKHNAQTT